jgi:hypothetical protein
MVPNPMINRHGVTQDGRTSEHTKAATAARIYLVIEFDLPELSVNTMAALHAHLGRHLPLVAVVFSGHQSLHGWFFVYQAYGVREFMAKAVRLGADSTTFCRSQFVRIPDGCREDGSRKTIFYFDPSKIMLP